MHKWINEQKSDMQLLIFSAYQWKSAKTLHLIAAEYKSKRNN